MSNQKLLLVAAATFAFIAAPATSFAKHHKHHDVKCYGVNGCKGKSACKTAKNACKGQNSCKGQGVVHKSEKKCKKLGGTTKE